MALRLSVWFATLFAVGFTAIFALLYWLLARSLEASEYEALQLRLRQYASIYELSGVRGLQQRVAEDSEAPNVRSLFIRLSGPRGDAVWGKIPPDWIEADVRRVTVPDGWGGWTAREQPINVLRVPRDAERDLAVVSQLIDDNLLLQVGRSTDSRAVLLAPLRRTFIWVGGAVIVVGSLAGYLAARRATRPLLQVVETARRIVATGALDARVPAPARADDVAELVHHFNTVLDKNAALLKAMREALDNVAHDLRTPLTGLRGSAELALSQTTDPVARDALAESVERADEVLRLLRALMEISEAEAGMLRLERAPCDLAELARRAVDLYDEIAQAKGLTLNFIPSGPVPITGDGVRLRQVAANLVDNACKYTPAGGKIDVRVVTEGDRAVLTVSDNGPGVPESEQARIWERLYRGDKSRSEAGLGLGLSLVRAVVTAHGGEVAVRNAPGGGAVFEVRLPRG
ncbi:MAG TPA: HAMP domain-containing sensor histidine kinase [Opitutaceae bacterium]